MFLRIETYPRRKSNKHTNKILRGFEWGAGFFVGFICLFFIHCMFQYIQMVTKNMNQNKIFLMKPKDNNKILF